MEERAVESVDFLRMAIPAALSVVALIGIGLWQAHQAIVSGTPVSATNRTITSLPERATTPYGSIDWQTPITDSPASVENSGEAKEDKDGIGNIAGNVVGTLVGSYTTLAEAGAYTPAEGEKIAEDIATSLRANVSYETYGVSDLKTDTDASYDRMLAYRSDLRLALEPLLKNPGYELGLFATYIETRDTKYTDLLKAAAENYREAVGNAAKVVVPKDAATEHVGILNALSEFGATVEAMAAHADDAFAAAALLRTYSESEAGLMTSFNTLAIYYTSKKP